MTDLASGSLWLNRAPIPDITPQGFHKIIPLAHTHHVFLHSLLILFSSMCVYECAYLCVQLPWLHQDYQFWDMPHALVPSFLWAFCLGYIASRFIDPTKGMRPGMYVGPSFFMWVLKGITSCLFQLLQKELWAPAFWPNRQYYTYPRLCGCSAPLCCLSPKRFFCASVDDLVGVQAVKAFPYIWMCELLAHEEV